MSSQNEFDFIARSLAPLSSGHSGAFNLTDDAVSLVPSKGCELVLTADMLVEGRHFLKTDPLDLVARKALRVNVSDLAAMGAKPRFYMLSLAWTDNMTDSDKALFVSGLEHDQAQFGVVLIGGDTTSSPGPFTISITAIGEAPVGSIIKRSGARPGDVLAVTGTIGDGYLGLKAAKGEGDYPQALKRYQSPEPRIAFASMIREIAHAGIDISDGLLADGEHLAKASQCQLEIDLDRLPLSSESKAWLNEQTNQTSGLIELATGGDDYELLLAFPQDKLEKASHMAQELSIPFNVIGLFLDGEGLNVLTSGKPVSVDRRGFTHF